MRADTAIMLLIAPLALPSPLTWSRLANSLMPKWASNPSFPFNRSSSELFLSVIVVVHFHLLLNCTTSSFFSTRLAREESTPSLADLFTSEAGAFIRQEEEDEIDSGADGSLDQLEGFSSQRYPPESENFTPELQSSTTELQSNILGPSGQDQHSYELYKQDIFPLVPSSEDSSSEDFSVSSVDKVDDTNSVSTSELEELANSLTRVGEMVVAAVRSVRSLVMTALQVTPASPWISRC